MQRTGKLPTYSEFLELLTTAKKLSAIDRLNLFIVFGKAQRPLLSGAELYDLLRAQQASLGILHVIYKVERPVPEPVNGKRDLEHVVESCSFAMQYPKLMFDKTTIIDGEFKIREIESFDGNILRRKVTRPDSIDFASVQHLDIRGRFFDESNPVLSAMFLNCSQESDLTFKEHYDAALLTQLTFVYESTEEVSGYHCIVIGNEQLQAFIAPELSYSIVKLKSGSLEVGPAGAYIRSPSYLTVDNSEFRKISNGVRLPMRSERIWVRQNEIYSHSITTVISYDTSPKDPEGLFAGDIPDGAYVADVVNNVSYVASSDDIEKTISKAVGNRSITSSRRWWLILVNGLTLAALLLVFIYRRRNR
jgi:hypothetical protein